MREFFDRVDSGAYDGPSLFMLIVLVVALTICARIASRRRKAAFFGALHEAQHACEVLGADHVTAQLKVLEALVAWQKWQHRPVPSWAEVGDCPSPEERLALTLLGSTPVQQASA